MITITIAPATHSSTCACSSERGSGLSRWYRRWTAVTMIPTSAAITSFNNSAKGCSGSALSSLPWKGRRAESPVLVIAAGH